MPSRGSATPSDCGTGGGGGVSGQMADTHTSSRLLGVAQLLDEIRFDPQRRSTDPPESALTSSNLELSVDQRARGLDGAAEFGALRRLRRRPRRQPAVSATVRTCPLLQTRPHPPPRPRAAASAAARARGARTFNQRVLHGFASILGDFLASRGTRHLNGQRVSAPAIAREASIS